MLWTILKVTTGAGDYLVYSVVSTQCDQCRHVSILQRTATRNFHPAEAGPDPVRRFQHCWKLGEIHRVEVSDFAPIGHRMILPSALQVANHMEKKVLDTVLQLSYMSLLDFPQAQRGGIQNSRFLRETNILN